MTSRPTTKTHSLHHPLHLTHDSEARACSSTGPPPILSLLALFVSLSPQFRAHLCVCALLVLSPFPAGLPLLLLSASPQAKNESVLLDLLSPLSVPRRLLIFLSMADKNQGPQAPEASSQAAAAAAVDTEKDDNNRVSDDQSQGVSGGAQVGARPAAAEPSAPSAAAAVPSALAPPAASAVVAPAKRRGGGGGKKGGGGGGGAAGSGSRGGKGGQAGSDV